MTGVAWPASRTRRTISGTASAARGVFTVIRTISDPAAARSMIWRAVLSASSVSVFVMDCTTTGAPPPTCTGPTMTGMLFFRSANIIALYSGTCRTSYRFGHLSIIA
jgi:hypothetical protein